MSLQLIKEIRRKIASYDITWWEIAPIIIAIFLPNFIEPSWLWRLIAVSIASLSLLVIFTHVFLAPEQIKKFQNIRSLKTKKYLFFLLYGAVIILMPFLLLYIVIPVTGDAYRVIQDSNQALDEKKIEVIEWQGGGIVAPYFIGQRLHTIDTIYYLPFSFKAWGPGSYQILYSPRTNIIYEVIYTQM
jgi:hypothetical protein